MRWRGRLLCCVLLLAACTDETEPGGDAGSKAVATRDAASSTGDDDAGNTGGVDGSVTCASQYEWRECIDGVCACKECPDSLLDCDLDGANGCELWVSRDPANCGSCGNSCGEQQVCEYGQCCPVGLHGEAVCPDYSPCNRTSDVDTRCDLRDNDCDGEVDDDVLFDTDPENCGSCGFTCPDAAECKAGKCVCDPESDAGPCDDTL